jgi:anti-sigma-K factor RskA
MSALPPAPDFDELLGGEDLADEERARLQRVHALLVEAGPPPDLTPRLFVPPAAREQRGVISLPRRRRGAVLLIAAALALAVFGAGWLGGAHSTGSHVARTIAMDGPGGAHASLAVLDADEAGNWPMTMKITGLAALPAGQTYSLWLTRRGTLEASCGTFSVGKGTTTVDLNAPYRLKEYDGWVIVRSGTTIPLLTTSATAM